MKAAVFVLYGYTQKVTKKAKMIPLADIRTYINVRKPHICDRKTLSMSIKSSN